MKTLKGFKSVLVSFGEHEIFTRAAALSYYSSLAMAPLILAAIAVLGILNLDMQDQLITQVDGMIGGSAADMLEGIIESSQEKRQYASISGLISLVLLIFSASIIFNELQNSLNLIFNARDTNPPPETVKEKVKFFVGQRLLSMGMVFTFIFIIIISLVVSAVMSYLFQNTDLWYYKPIQLLVDLSVFQVLFALIVKVLPSRKISFKRSFFAGFVISILFVLGKFGIGLYLANAAIGSSYGAAGSLAVLLVWFYYSALIVYFGCELSYALVIEK